MVLGVLYHALLFGGGMMAMGFGGSPTAASRIMDWLHSFRMPAFFLISGFFSHMMLIKYGFGRYLLRRYWRIALPLVIVLFVLGGIRGWRGSAGFPGTEPGPWGNVAGGGSGSFQFGPRPGGTTNGWSPGQRQAGASFDFSGFMGQSSPIAQKLFGGFSRNLGLQHLWFLCYLLVFATVAPVVTQAITLLARGPRGDALNRAADRMLRCGFAPLALALTSIIGLVLSGTSAGNPPGGMRTIMGSFPDVFFRYDPDWPYFFIYFLGGWWMYQFREGLPAVGRLWFPVFLIGFGAYVASAALTRPDAFAFMPAPQRISEATLARYALFSVAVAFTVFGFIGCFQRYLNRPTWTGRYLADTAFWIYLVHQDLLNMVVLRWVRPWGMPQLIQAVVAVAITTAIALVTFELVIRPTPLTNLFGPPRRKKAPATIPTRASTEMAPL